MSDNPTDPMMQNDAQQDHDVEGVQELETPQIVEKKTQPLSVDDVHKQDDDLPDDAEVLLDHEHQEIEMLETAKTQEEVVVEQQDNSSDSEPLDLEDLDDDQRELLKIAKGSGTKGYRWTGPELSMLCAKREKTLLKQFGGLQAVLDGVKLDPQRGVASGQEADERAKQFGTNEMPKPKSKNIIQLFIEALKDPMLIILIFMSIISIVLGVAFPESQAEAGETETTTQKITSRLLGIIEGGAIMFAVLIVSTVTAVNDYQKEKKFREISKKNDTYKVKVVRDGDTKAEVYVQKLVVGDIIRLAGGDNVAADGLVLTASALEVDESAMTGETDMIKKGPQKNPFMLSGCKIQNGTGTMLVTAVGVNSEWGKTLSKLTDKPPENTPLQDKLDDLAKLIGQIGVVFATLTFLVLLIGFTIERAIDTTKGKAAWSLSDFSTIVRYMVIAVTIVVVAVPEGLPLAVTISLAYSVKKMLVDQNLVRRLEACETMGGASNICSDKTGTLTENEMTVVKGFFVGKFSDLKSGHEQLVTRDTFPALADGESTFDILVDGICVNTGADLLDKAQVEALEKKKLEDEARRSGKKIKKERGPRWCCCIPKINVPSSTVRKIKKIPCLGGFILGFPFWDVKKVQKGGKSYTVTGSKTEGALLVMCDYHFDLRNQVKATVEQTDEKTGETHEVEKIGYAYVREVKYSTDKYLKDWPFNSTLKRMSTIVRNDKGKPRIYTKGASEWVLKLCTNFINQEGEKVQFTDNDPEGNPEHTRDFIYNTYISQEMAQKGFRTLVLAYRDLDDDELKVDENGNPIDGFPAKDDWNQEDFEKDMTLICIVGIKDPVRDPVPNAVSACQKAGIIVRMVTGDNIETAKFIARECHILTDKGSAITGPDFEKLSVEEIDEILPDLQVMARSSPIDKYNLVKRLRELGEVVAVTGDGTNDAPALKEADVGLSMGIAGTQVAQEASDIVILDDNFKSIVKAVLWGRSIFENIRKFLQFQVTVNVVALVLTVITAITSFVVPPQEEGGTNEPPLTAVQLLWVNLIMDTFAALALATEEPENELLQRKPYGRNDPLINKFMWSAILTQAGYQLFVLCLIYYGGPYFDYSDNSTRNNTIVFNAFVFCQLFNEFNSRKVNNEFNILKNIGKSYIFILIFLITAIAQIAIVQLGWKLAHTEGLNWWQFIMSILFGLLSVPIGIIRTATVRLILLIYKKVKGVTQGDKANAEQLADEGEM